jgi:ABC-type hemin transport system substrate-binding protein
MITIIDDAGRSIMLPRAARRIVSLVPSLTETLATLGCGDALVGVTRYCTEPADALRHVERVGGTKNPDGKRIRALQPDLIVLNAEENRREDFDAFERAGLPMFVLFPHRVSDVLGLIDKLGALTGCVAAARRMHDELNDALGEAQGWVRATRWRVFCPIWKNPWMSFNRDTYVHDLLRLAGGENVCGGRAERYCAITLEDIASEDPQVVLLPDEPYVFAPKDLASLAPLAATSAGESRRIHFIDGRALSWYGPRTAPALRYLRGMIAGPAESHA